MLQVESPDVEHSNSLSAMCDFADDHHDHDLNDSEGFVLFSSDSVVSKGIAERMLSSSSSF